MDIAQALNSKQAMQVSLLK